MARIRLSKWRPVSPELNIYINGLCGAAGCGTGFVGVYGAETREEHEDMPELQACNRSLPSTLPVLASLVSLSLGLAAVSSARAHKAPAFEQVGTASWVRAAIPRQEDRKR